MDEQERYEAGREVRRAVLGDAYVEQSLANVTPFNAPFHLAADVLATDNPDEEA